MKNTIYVAIIAVCLIVAVVVFVKTRSSGSPGFDELTDAKEVWLICINPACGNTFQMGQKTFAKEMTEKAKSGPALAIPFLTCPKCGKDSVTEAIKCEKCGNIFRSGSVPADFPDRCPKCKYSKTEATRKARLGETAPSQ